MSRHNYTNPAFCQKSEFYSAASPSQNTEDGIFVGGNVRIHRSESMRSFRTNVRKINGVNLNHQQQQQQKHNSQQPQLPPKPGPKPLNLNRSEPFQIPRSGSGRYALVPVEELPTVTQDRYAIIPGPESNSSQRDQRFAKSQDNIDRYSHLPVKDQEHLSFDDEPCSLPNFNPHTEEPRLKAAFSSDFGSKSFVLVDQKNNQRYAVVPTAEDEDLVDDHEIIQMHNGKTHRYAVIPTDEEETCLSNSDINQSINSGYSTIQDSPSRRPLQSSTPQRSTSSTVTHNHHQQQQQNSYPGTPIKNPLATKKLHELLSTPRKTPIQRSNSTPKSTPRRYQSQQIYIESPLRQQELTPQKLQYETKKAYLEARTTAVITPRVATSNQEENSLNRSWIDSYPQKVANATATIAVVSLMLVLGSALNSGLCMYLIANTGRSFYLEFGLTASFAGIGLGILGFKSRHCEWLPNRSYISGYILVTVFCLLKCCGLLVLLALHPMPGYPLHDVTTGVILGLSTFTIFFIGLGVIGSYWCYRPPPDNRVNVY